jgi:hypothetical protein
MSIKSGVRELAPFGDRYDVGFALGLGMVLLAGVVAFVDTPTLGGVVAAVGEFMRNSGMLVLLTSITAIVAVYRLRHRPEKARPAVREDIETVSGGPGDFGLRNYGPGPALYVQAVATTERRGQNPDVVEEVARILPHDTPLHLREGELLSVSPEDEEAWAAEMAETSTDARPSKTTTPGRRDRCRVSFFSTYVSR